MTPTLTLHNTLSGRLEPFSPKDPTEVRVYCCGPTVYSFQHIGNFKTFLFEDLLVRTLRLIGYGVKHVMNITDVGHLTDDADSGEDKMLLAMRREGKSSAEIAAFYTERFFADWDALNLVRPSVVCKATDHIEQMILLVERLQKAGFAYEAGGNVYFDVEKFPSYGELGKLDLEGMRAGARVVVDPHKKSPFDFALWFTRSKFENQELTWDSPWGRGYPGWHIECSAMGMCHLGEQVDIHCGGIDHIPVHHTNEIAQSEAAIGHRWVSTWMHGEFMQINAEKMSKSIGNLICLSDLAEQGVSPLAFRYLCLMSHYRSQLNFTWEAVENAQLGYTKLCRAVLNLKATAAEERSSSNVPDASPIDLPGEFIEALCDDLNTPRAMAVLVAVLKDNTRSAANRLAILSRADQVLGLRFDELKMASTDEFPEQVKRLLEQRASARMNKDWKGSDVLRDELLALGYRVKDTPKGQEVELVGW